MFRTLPARIILALTAAGICGASLYPPWYWHGVAEAQNWNTPPRLSPIRDSGGYGWVWQREAVAGTFYLAQVDLSTLFVEYIAILSGGTALLFAFARHKKPGQDVPPTIGEQAVPPDTGAQTVKCEDCGRLVKPRHGACPECGGPLI